VKRNEAIVRYTDKELDAMRRRDEDRTEEQRLEAMSDAEVEAASQDEGAFDWKNARAGFPIPKGKITVSLDQDVINWFKSQGRSYEAHINSVLRRHVEEERSRSD